MKEFIRITVVMLVAGIGGVGCGEPNSERPEPSYQSCSEPTCGDDQGCMCEVSDASSCPRNELCVQFQGSPQFCTVPCFTRECPPGSKCQAGLENNYCVPEKYQKPNSENWCYKYGAGGGGCCMRCDEGKPCGDACIPSHKECHTVGGCACY